MSRIYGVAASRHTIDGDYVSAMQLPMFYLSSGTQGIIDEPHASRIASEIVGEPVTAFDVTADFIAAAAPSILAPPAHVRQPIDHSSAVIVVHAWCDYPSGLPVAELRNFSPHQMRFAARYAVTRPSGFQGLTIESGYVILGPWEAVSWTSGGTAIAAEVWHSEPAPADPHAPVAPSSRGASVYCPATGGPGPGI